MINVIKISSVLDLDKEVQNYLLSHISNDWSARQLQEYVPIVLKIKHGRTSLYSFTDDSEYNIIPSDILTKLNLK